MKANNLIDENLPVDMKQGLWECGLLLLLQKSN
jgi:hypothetical protein